MKTKLLKLNFNRLNFFSLMLFLLCVNLSWSQQVIGEFPEIDGGMENQTADATMSSAGSSQSGTPQTTWTVSSTSNAAVRAMTDDAAEARTGSFSASIAVLATKTNLRLQSPSPTSPTIQTNTEYTIQFFYRSDVDPGTSLDPGIYLNNTSGGDAGNKTDVGSFAADTWTKTYRVETTGATFNASNWGVARISTTASGGYNSTVHIDDFVIYAGSYDDTAPDAPTSGTHSETGGTATIGWTAPAGGVDGGGYVVFKYASEPASDNDPNQNGIYEVGSTTTNGTGALLGTVAYIGTATTFDDTYVSGSYYKVYAVDKAFNYSDEITISAGGEVAVETPGAVVAGQVIGEFPTMDGGMENQTAADPMPTISSTGTTSYVNWSIGSSSGADSKKIVSGEARTGTKSGVHSLAATKTNSRFQTPTNPSDNYLIQNTDYIIQYFYRAAEDPRNNMRASVYMNGTSDGENSSYQDDTPAFVADVWVKYAETVTTDNVATAVFSQGPGNYACMRLDGDGTNYNLKDVDLDDFVVYAGSTVDETAPSAVTTGTYVNNSGTATIGWAAPAGGVDGGGYVVVKYTSEPAADNDPNQNGIYNVGNTITNGTGSLLGTVAYIGTSASFNDTYASGNYYKVYTVDKAFNYSNEITISDTALAINKITLQSEINIYPNPATSYIVIDSKNHTISSVELYNLLGEKVLGETKLSDNKLDISQLNKGVYILKVNSENGVINKRIIVQ